MRNAKGFTLLELIIVVIVIGILIAMILPQFATVVERGQVAKAKAGLDAIRKAEGIYKTVKGFYDGGFGSSGQGLPDGLVAEIPELGSLGATDTDWDYGVVANPPIAPPAFLATATRQSGEYEDDTITIDQLGQIGGNHALK